MIYRTDRCSFSVAIWVNDKHGLAVSAPEHLLSRNDSPLCALHRKVDRHCSNPLGRGVLKAGVERIRFSSMSGRATAMRLDAVKNG
jgi:hypothetical protein